MEEDETARAVPIQIITLNTIPKVKVKEPWTNKIEDDPFEDLDLKQKNKKQSIPPLDQNLMSRVHEDCPEFSNLNMIRPLVSELITYNNKHIFMCSVDKFKKRFKIDNDNEIFDILDELDKSGANPVLAGGKLISWLNGERNSKNDFDLFFTSEQDPQKFQEFCDKREDIKFFENVVYLSEWMHKDKNKLQVIVKHHSCIEDIIEGFDLLCCCIAYFKGNIYWIKGAVTDARRKRIRLNRISESASSGIRRAFKYAAKGFEIKIPDLLCLSAALVDESYKIFHDGSAIKYEEMFNRRYVHDRHSAYADFNFFNTNTH